MSNLSGIRDQGGNLPGEVMLNDDVSTGDGGGTPADPRPQHLPHRELVAGVGVLMRPGLMRVEKR